ncbi:MAG: translocation/assembly module TamB [Proteobacteria bacterium]|nr:translocation/assembly module TamB [Pseudomonadota bacterium]
MANLNYPAKGNIKGDFHVEGPLKSVVVTAKMKADRLRLYGETIDNLTFRGKLNKQRIDINRLLISMGKGTVVSTGTIEPEKEINLDLQITNINPGDFRFIKKKAGNITGNINLHCTLTGKSTSPDIEGELESIHLEEEDKKISLTFGGDLSGRAELAEMINSTAELKVKHFQVTPLGYNLNSTAPFNVNYVDHEVIISGLSAKGKQSNVDLNGKISSSGILDLILSGETEVAGSERYLKPVEEMSGALTFNSTIKGSTEKPLLNATLKADKGLVRFVGFPYDLTDIKGELTLEQNRMTIDSVDGKLEGAQFSGGGNLIFNKLFVDESNLYFDVEEVALRFPSWLSSKGHGRITVTSKGKEATLGSDLEITRAIYSEEFDFRKLMKKDSAEAVKEEKSAKKAGLNFNMHFRADDNIIIKNDSADVEMKGYLNLLGQPNNTVLIGKIEVIGGKVYFHNKEFSIINGDINFADTEKINPFFELEGETNVKDYNVHLSVSGYKDNYTLDLSSNPPLEEKEIVSLLVLGYTSNELKTEGTEMTSIEALSLLLQGELESKVKKYFGFDRFQIDPYYSEYSGSTEARITVGKELRENLTATYSRGLSSLQEEQLNVEYRVDDNLSLMGSWSSEEAQDGQFGGDVILRYEFW